MTMEQAIQATGLCVLAAVLALTVKRGSPETAGIALVVKVGGGLCADAGESALASVVETAGTVCALAAALPLLRRVAELLMELMA